jgi:predicted RNA-binding Zn ribbon-like protein
MHFNHYGGEAALLSTDLINLDRPVTRQQVRQLLQTYRVADPECSTIQAGAIGEWARELARCFDATDLAQQCAVINDLLSTAASKPYISLHDGHPHLHYRALDDDVVARVRAITISGLAYLVCFAGGHRLGRCARPGCRRAYVDTSRNGRRQYCCVRCANTSAVSRHRRRARSHCSPE